MSVQTAEQLINQLQTSYDWLCEVLSWFEPAERSQPRRDGGWSPTAVLAHVAFWDDYQTRRMQAALSGQSVERGFVRPAGDNDERATTDHARPWDEVVAAADAARMAMIDFARSLPAAALQQSYPDGQRMLSLRELLEHMIRHTQAHAGDLHQYVGSLQRWSRAGLRAFVVQQHNNLLDSIGGMTEEACLTTQITDAWTVRDVLTHVLSWNEFAWRVISAWPNADPAQLAPWLAGQEAGPDGPNARLLAERADLEMIPLADALATYHRRMLRAFDAASDAELASQGSFGFGDQGELARFYFEFAVHDAHHARQIWEYRAGEWQ